MEMLSSTVVYVLVPVFLLVERLWYAKPGRLSAWEKAGALQEKLANSRFAAALVLTAVEFQEAQAFFAIALQTAALMMFPNIDSRGGDAGQRLINENTGYNVAINAIIPVFFFQACLQSKAVRSWYTLGLTVVGYVLAASIIPRDPGSYLDGYEELVRAAVTDECGGNPHPRAMCYYFIWKKPGDFVLFEKTARARPTLLVTTVVLPFLIMDQILSSLWGRQIWKAVRAKLVKDPPRWAQGSWKWICRSLWIVLRLSLLILMALYFATALKMIYRLPTESSAWSFGQVIALAVWVPVVAKLIYFIIRK
jgi:hypothetical protein